MSLNESIVEGATPEWFGGLGYAIGNGRIRDDVDQWREWLADSAPVRAEASAIEARLRAR